jgi:hypothetical protein
LSILEQAIQDSFKGKLVFCKFISANDAGATGAHQAGLYFPLESWPILFESPGQKGENKEKFVTIRWQDDFETDSRFIYYGQKTRNEYRITRFGRGFPFLKDEYVGSLFVIVQISSEYYRAYVIESDEDIESFLNALGISASQTNRLISNIRNETPTLYDLFSRYILSLQIDFPTTAEISDKAREFYKVINDTPNQRSDHILLGWLDTEYALFEAIEHERYKTRIATPFLSVDELVDCANTLLNRRKSRAGKSLEHHLNEVFRMNHLHFESQVVTEGNKKPDFIFPGSTQYHDLAFNGENLVFLGAKTTCKDRWRQILNEADRIPTKHLFTLQQGISANQLEEMYKHQVILVVPKPYINTFPNLFRDRILSLEGFISMVKNKCYN